MKYFKVNIKLSKIHEEYVLKEEYGFFFSSRTDYALCGYLVSGNYALFGLVVKNPVACFVRKVFARGNLLPGKFWVFVPLLSLSMMIFVSIFASLH